jgi:hypothetical protein
VAYHHQNFSNGKFSYRQIEVLVEKLEQRGDGKVLVILPYTYATRNNSCREFYSSVKLGKSKLTVTEADQVPCCAPMPNCAVCTLLRCVALCYSVLQCIVLCYAALGKIILCYTLVYSIVSYCARQQFQITYLTLSCCTVLCCTFSTTLLCTTLYCTVFRQIALHCCIPPCIVLH